MVESASDEILRDAQNVDVAFLVVGDPFGYIPLFPSLMQILKYIAISNVRVQGNNTHRPRPPRPRTLHPYLQHS